MRVPFILILLALAVVPQAAAHAAPDPLDVEVHVLADDVDDLYALYGGFDIQDVYVRDAALPAYGGTGIVVRAYLYGGPGPAAAISDLDVEFDVDAGGRTHTFVVSTPDGATWSGDAPVVEAAFGPGAEPGAIEGYVQVLLLHAALGVSTGDTVGNLVVRTRADGDLRDVAPGGRPVPGTNGAVVEPRESTVITAEWILPGPSGYTRSTAAGQGDAWTFTVENQITTTGQHIVLEPVEVAGWTVEGPEPAAVSVEPGVHPTFGLTATGQAGAAPLVIHIRTDLGGLESLALFAPDADGGTVPVEGEAKESPGPALLLALAAVVGLAARRRAL